MCGLVGRLIYADAPDGGPEEDTERRLLALVARRGPDDEGVWSDHRGCMIGLRRLSILNVSPAGHQPMCTTDGRYALVYNGELYNFHELRAELGWHLWLLLSLALWERRYYRGRGRVAS